ncbi:unnamed protein product [Rotaria sp. Silwood1]|nr:unnamed protein product [Rotaria sp. Silwood1]
MNTSEFDQSMIIIQSWFIPLDIIHVICCSLSIILPVIYLFIIIIDKTYVRISMIHIVNSCLSELGVGSVMFDTALFSLKNDLKQIQIKDSFCKFRAYFGYVFVTIVNCSFLLQALFRYTTVIYPAHLF